MKRMSVAAAVGVSLLLSVVAASLADETPNAKSAQRGTRTPWTTSRIKGSPEPPLPYTIERIFPRLQFDKPVELVKAPGSDRLFIAQQDGKIFSFPRDNDAAKADLFADFSKHGVKDFLWVYSIEFDPEFETNRYVYVSYVLKPDIEDGTKVSRFEVTKTDPPRLVPESEKVLLTWVSGGHNGACLKFGPDGDLYISTGDGSGPFPPDSRGAGQDVSNLLSAILRIDVRGEQPGLAYRIPADNPFVGRKGARGEIWSYGHRNPWKMHFDSETGDLWVGDVGWEMWEMVYRIQKGGNYGWSIVEGPQSVNPEWKRGPTQILPPTIQHSHTEARSITGGTVYRGERLPELKSQYVYGDYVTGKIWSAEVSGSKVGSPRELADTPLQIICFGVDRDRELIVVAYDGTLYRLVPNPAHGRDSDFPKKLSETGLFKSVKELEPAAGVVRYSINAAPWEDGAVSVRFVAVPGDVAVEEAKTSDFASGVLKGHPKFPKDTVFAKTVALEMEQGNPFSLRRLETQILHNDGQTWRGYSYIWNEAQDEATLAGTDGQDETYVVLDRTVPWGKRRQTWHFASRAECLLCHTTRAGSIHGFTAQQLNRASPYNTDAPNQLERLVKMGLMPESTDLSTPPLANPHDPYTPLNARARAYLHVNCAHCHRRGGGGTAAFDIRYENPLEKTGLLNARPTQGTFGIYGAEVISAGAPSRSVLWYRMAKLGRGRMPHFGSTVVDKYGTDLMFKWISAMPSNPLGQPREVSKADKHQQQLLAVLQQAFGNTSKPEKAKDAIDSLLSSPSGAMLLMRAIETNSLKPSGSSAVVEAAVKHQDVRVRDLFERFVPEEQRTRRLGSVVDAQQILEIDGNAANGRKLFETGIGVSCRNCHTIRDVGFELGPDLSKIARERKQEELLESLLEPSKKIDKKYQAYLVQTTQGKLYTGLLVRRTADEVVLRDAQRKEIRIATDDVEMMAPQDKSLMPELLLRDMTARQVADLLAYLMRQK